MPGLPFPQLGVERRHFCGWGKLSRELQVEGKKVLYLYEEKAGGESFVRELKPFEIPFSICFQEGGGRT